MEAGNNVSKVLSSILRWNNRCVYLSLRKNKLGDNGIIELAKAIQNSITLVHIDLASTGIGTNGGIALFQSLKSNQSVTSLDLSSCQGSYHNRVGQFSTPALVPVLRNNKILSIFKIKK